MSYSVHESEAPFAGTHPFIIASWNDQNAESWSGETLLVSNYPNDMGRIVRYEFGRTRVQDDISQMIPSDALVESMLKRATAMFENVIFEHSREEHAERLFNGMGYRFYPVQRDPIHEYLLAQLLMNFDAVEQHVRRMEAVTSSTQLAEDLKKCLAVSKVVRRSVQDDADDAGAT